MNSIAQAASRRHFHRPPIGPIGSLLTLAEERWGVAVEMACGRALGTFVVHNFEDQRLLQVKRLQSHETMDQLRCSVRKPD